MAGKSSNGGSRARSTTAATWVGDEASQIAARRLIAGHVDTSDLDPLTARAVEILTAADLVVAADRLTEQTLYPERRRMEAALGWTGRWAPLIVILLVFASLLFVSVEFRTYHDQSVTNQQIQIQELHRVIEFGCQLSSQGDPAAYTRCVASATKLP